MVEGTYSGVAIYDSEAAHYGVYVEPSAHIIANGEYFLSQA